MTNVRRFITHKCQHCEFYRKYWSLESLSPSKLHSSAKNKTILELIFHFKSVGELLGEIACLKPEVLFCGSVFICEMSDGKRVKCNRVGERLVLFYKNTFIRQHLYSTL